jgi:hypothetical protein
VGQVFRSVSIYENLPGVHDAVCVRTHVLDVGSDGVRHGSVSLIVGLLTASKSNGTLSPWVFAVVNLAVIGQLWRRK